MMGEPANVHSSTNPPADYGIPHSMARAGFEPWVLSEGLPNADLFVGLSYSSIQLKKSLTRLVAYVNVFDRYGRWQYYRGSSQPIAFGRRNKEFREIIRGAVQEYQVRTRLQRVHVHHRYRLRREDRREIAAGIFDVEPEAEVSFVRINTHTPVRMFDESLEGDGSLPRGSYVIAGPNQFYISTTGWNIFGQTAMGTPTLLDVSVNRFQSREPLDLKIYAQHILSLTKLNWASSRSFCHDPITIKFASDIAYLMNVFLHALESFHLHPELERTPWFL